MCECYQIGGRFIAEDPDCPVHGYNAQQIELQIERERPEVLNRLMEFADAYRMASQELRGKRRAELLLAIEEALP